MNVHEPWNIIVYIRMDASYSICTLIKHIFLFWVNTGERCLMSYHESKNIHKQGKVHYHSTVVIFNKNSSWYMWEQDRIHVYMFSHFVNDEDMRATSHYVEMRGGSDKKIKYGNIILKLVHILYKCCPRLSYGGSVWKTGLMIDQHGMIIKWTTRRVWCLHRQPLT